MWWKPAWSLVIGTVATGLAPVSCILCLLRGGPNAQLYVLADGHSQALHLPQSLLWVLSACTLADQSRFGLWLMNAPQLPVGLLIVAKCAEHSSVAGTGFLITAMIGTTFAIACSYFLLLPDDGARAIAWHPVSVAAVALSIVRKLIELGMVHAIHRSLLSSTSGAIGQFDAAAIALAFFGSIASLHWALATPAPNHVILNESLDMAISTLQLGTVLRAALRGRLMAQHHQDALASRDLSDAYAPSPARERSPAASLGGVLCRPPQREFMPPSLCATSPLDCCLLSRNKGPAISKYTPSSLSLCV
jgi:hypothetical protein